MNAVIKYSILWGLILTAKNMTIEHKFGGDWTEAKLNCLKNYLESYRKIFTANEKAKYFRTWYVDAFAGTGERAEKTDQALKGGLFGAFDEADDATKYRSGSVDIALSLLSPFDKYLFVEKSASHTNQLRTFLANKHPNAASRIECISGDANEKLVAWTKKRDWKKDRAVVFLDPYGLQVKWETIRALAATKGVDLWYLFPLGLGPMRMIPRDGNVPQEWSDKLDGLFGTHAWKERFFRPAQQASLFDESPQLERQVSAETVSAFVKERLETCFCKVANGLVLHNSKNSPMYLLCFAVANERGSKPALSIAKSILEN